MNYIVSSTENYYVASSIVDGKRSNAAKLISSPGRSKECALLAPWADRCVTGASGSVEMYYPVGPGAGYVYPVRSG